MRDRLRPVLPELLRFYPQLRPWDLEDLTYDEVNVLLEHAEEVAAAATVDEKG